MTIQDVAVTIMALSTLGILGWAVYQTIALKKDVDLLSILKELETLYDAVDKILDEVGVETVDEAITEIQVLKGNIPTIAQEESAWQAPQEPHAKPAEKK